MIEVDPITQCEIRDNRTKNRGLSQVLLKCMMMNSLLGGSLFNNVPTIHSYKSELYYIKLNKREQKLPYEVKQDIKKVRLALKYMEELSPLQKVYKYKFR